MAEFAAECTQHTWVLGKTQTMWFLNGNEVISREKGKTGEGDKALSEEVETGVTALNFLPRWF